MQSSHHYRLIFVQYFRVCQTFSQVLLSFLKISGQKFKAGFFFKISLNHYWCFINEKTVGQKDEGATDPGSGRARLSILNPIFFPRHSPYEKKRGSIQSQVLTNKPGRQRPHSCHSHRLQRHRGLAGAASTEASQLCVHLLEIFFLSQRNTMFLIFLERHDLLVLSFVSSALYLKKNTARKWWEIVIDTRLDSWG